MNNSVNPTDAKATIERSSLVPVGKAFDALVTLLSVSSNTGDKSYAHMYADVNGVFSTDVGYSRTSTGIREPSALPAALRLVSTDGVSIVSKYNDQVLGTKSSPGRRTLNIGIGAEHDGPDYPAISASFDPSASSGHSNFRLVWVK